MVYLPIYRHLARNKCELRQHSAVSFEDKDSLLFLPCSSLSIGWLSPSCVAVDKERTRKAYGVTLGETRPSKVVDYRNIFG